MLAAQEDASTGTRGRVMRQVERLLTKRHGEGVVPVPPRSTFYRLINDLAHGQHSFGQATTRRSQARRPEAPFTPTTAARPGEIVQIDTTPLDVLAVLDDGVTGRVELTIAVDVATRGICAAVLRPAGTKAVDAALLLARMLVPEPLRPGWIDALRMSASLIPHARLMGLDARLEHATAKPVIVPETIVIDHGRVFVSETFLTACRTLGVSVQPARPATPTDKGVVERTFSSINTLFCQHVAGYVGSNVTERGADVEAAWTLPELADLFAEWMITCWQTRPHDGLRTPFLSGRALSPNEAYALLVARSGYLPVCLDGDDYVKLLPVEWRKINDYGIRIDYRTYDCVELDPYRRQPSGVETRGGLWEVHHDPYDLSHVWVRDSRQGGWITVPWTRLGSMSAPFADFT
ncbi:Mu transposase C-terminal domain-containing protein [Protofrankia symbiont of Coriaria ruscifolia]|uniref:Mu transposase C-terminal domain-containing protein n=1 Tax=Protofrankia symbiont of Coriaria ruscifolia TaxID=1306542 RepID=UPI001F5E8263|nr:Mu transposase C-terminal domain-containing protein [Protofrankia symbiont of Coriaria ruscifolia]